MLNVKLYTQEGCQPCVATERKLTKEGIEFSTVDIRENPDGEQMVRDLGYSGTPVVYVDENTHWQGYSPDKIAALKV